MHADIDVRPEPEDLTVATTGCRRFRVYEPVRFPGLEDAPAKFMVPVPIAALPDGLSGHLCLRTETDVVFAKSNHRPQVGAPVPGALAEELRILDALNRPRDRVFDGRALEIGIRPCLLPDSMTAHVHVPQDPVTLLLLWVRILS